MESDSNTGTAAGSKDQVLLDIRGKIDRERKIILGIQNLRKTTTNAEVIQRCNTQIRDTQLNIDYLQETLSKLTLQKDEEDSGAATLGGGSASSTSLTQTSNGQSLSPIYLRLDLIKYDCPSLGHRIQYMLQQLEFKLQVENQYKAANAKISQLYLLDGDKLSSVAAEGGRFESDQRIQLLNKALRRYQGMHVDVQEVTRDLEIINAPKYARRPLLGKLIISITCIKDIDHIASPMLHKKPESFIAIKVDDVEKARTKPLRLGRWTDEFVIDVDKGHEIELTVYDKSGNSDVPVAITWMLLSDITEEIRKKKVAQDLGNSGWISANNLKNDALGRSPINESFKHTNSLSATASTLDNLDSTISSSGDTNNIEGKLPVVSNWLIVEPVGQILVSMSFEKASRVGGSKPLVGGGLGRHGAIRQKKEEIYELKGHQFVQKQFYNIMCCAFCGEFLRYTGFQCQDCKFLCHKKCYQKVVTKCISTSSSYDTDDVKLNHRIPHRFESVPNRGTKWCCHCGYILPWGRKNVRKCLECGIMCHTSCKHLVPDFCGMSMETANKILTAISTSKRSSQSAPSRKPLLPTKGQQPDIYHQQKQIQSPVESFPVSQSRVNIPPTIPLGNGHHEGSKIADESPEDDEYVSQLPTHSTNEYQQEVSMPYPKVQSVTTLQPEPTNQRSRISHGYPDDTMDEDNNYSYINKGEDYGNVNNSFIGHGALALGPVEDVSEVESQPATGHHDQRGNQQEQHQHQQHQQQQQQQQQQQLTISPRRQTKKRRRKVGLDDFQFLAVLGKGNFGKVMLAESRRTQKLCAIKVLKKDFIVENDEADSVKLEKRVFLTANKEMHPFLLNLHCCFQTENRIYFVMEYISGGDLMWHIQKSRFSAKRAKFYACEVLLGLKHFHDNGIVYRDLKLDNILLTTKGHIKIADYGLCKENMWFKNTTGTFCGTPEFMAPEIIAGKQYDRSVDWWAFGVLLFQMLLCQSPFKGDDEDEIFNAIEHDEVRYPISMPRQTVLILQALLTKDANSRLGSGERDAEEIMEHPYFDDIDFNQVLNCEINPPYLPEVTSEHDYLNFDHEFTSETPRLTPVDIKLTSEMQEQFRGFSHISDDAAI